jgi:hypothetical protein
MFPYCQAFDCFHLRRASVSLALKPLIYFMLAPVNSLAIGECSDLWAWMSDDGSFNLTAVVSENEKDKRLILPVLFGCAIENARDEAEKAIRNLAVEILAPYQSSRVSLGAVPRRKK